MEFKKLVLAPAALAAMAFCVPASAVMTLNLNDGSTNVTISDNGAGDLDAAVGTILYTGPFGVWTINVQTGTSNAPGTITNANLHLTSTLKAGSAGYLDMTLADTFTAPLGAGNLTFASGGAGTVTGSLLGYGQKLDRKQQFFQTPDCSYALTSGAFAGCAVSTGHPELFSAFEMKLYQRVTVTGASQTFSIDTDVNNVPEPGTLAIFGLGLLGLAGVRRRKI